MLERICWVFGCEIPEPSNPPLKGDSKALYPVLPLLRVASFEVFKHGHGEDCSRGSRSGRNWFGKLEVFHVTGVRVQRQACLSGWALEEKFEVATILSADKQFKRRVLAGVTDKI